jgi:hypothetical protein
MWFSCPGCKVGHIQNWRPESFKSVKDADCGTCGKHFESMCACHKCGKGFCMKCIHDYAYRDRSKDKKA